MILKDYSHYKAYDLLQDDEFLEYCLRPDEESVRMWDRLVRADRALAEEVEKAQQFIRNIHHQEQRMRPEEKVQVWEAIRRNCRESFTISDKHGCRLFITDPGDSFLVVSDAGGESAYRHRIGR